MPLVEVFINATPRLFIVALKRCLKSGRIDAQLGRKLLSTLAMHDIPACDMGAEVACAGIDVTEAVLANERAIANQPRGNGTIPVVRLVHGFDKIVIGVSLVAKAAPSTIDRDQARFAPIKRQMRK